MLLVAALAGVASRTGALPTAAAGASSAPTTLALVASPAGTGLACTSGAPCGLQEALDRAATAHPGGAVRIDLLAGSYRGAYTYRDGAPTAPSRVVLAGPSALPGATIDSGGSGPDLTVDSTAGAFEVLDVTLTGGRAAEGGALDVLGGSLVLEGDTLFANAATGSGGAVFLAPGAYADIEGSTIVEDSAPAEGAIAASGAIAHLQADVIAADGTAPACSAPAIADYGHDFTDDASCLGGAPATTSLAGSGLDARLFGVAPALQPAGEPGAVVPILPQVPAAGSSSASSGPAATVVDPAYDDVAATVRSIVTGARFCSQRDERGAERLQLGATSCSSGADQWAPAVVKSFTPSSGAAGTTVTVLGTGFRLATAVELGGVAASPRIRNDRRLSFVVPSGAAPGAVPLTVLAADGGCSCAGNFTVLPPLAVTTSSLPGAEVGAPYTVSLSGSGGASPYSWKAGGSLPAGLTLGSTGELSGVPQAAGQLAVPLTMVDANGDSTSVTLTVAVLPPPTVQTQRVHAAHVDRPYDAVLHAVGGTPPYTWSVASGGIPDGLILESDGTLDGRAARAGNDTMTLAVTDALGVTTSGRVSVDVLRSPPPPQVYAVLSASGALTLGDGTVLAVRGGRRARVAGVAPARHGWWVALRSGRVVPLGGAPALGGLPRRLARKAGPVVGIASSGTGYLLATAGGAVFGFGADRRHGRLHERHGRRVVGIAVEPGGRGYWLLSSGGHVHAFGSAPALGSPHGRRIGRAVAIAAASSGGGYWVVTGLGNVFAFGSAGASGSVRPDAAAGPIVAMAAAPQGSGYWLVSKRGYVYAFGTARPSGRLPVGARLVTAQGAAGAPGSSSPPSTGSGLAVIAPPAGSPTVVAVAATT